MTIQDIEHYVIRYNLDSASRKEELVYQRMFLYAYLYHHHKWTLRNIATLFKKKDHVTIRHALLEADDIQHREEFITATALLMEQTKFIIPPYKYKGRKYNKKSATRFSITVNVKKEQYINYLKSKDQDIVFDAIWDLFVKHIKYAKR
jgi:hypothetical protein